MFYMSKYSDLYDNNNKYVPICKICLNKFFDKVSRKTQSEKIALMVCCHFLDVVFIEELYEMLKSRQDMNIGGYLRLLNGKQYRGKNFVSCLIEGISFKTQEQIEDQKEIKWEKDDKQNKHYVISTYGYDPFENISLTDEDKRYLFNSLAGYCDDPSVSIDNHKLQSVVQLVLMQSQCRKIDNMINAELLIKPTDDKKIKDLSTTKKQLLDGIAGIVRDNNIASNYNASSKQGADTATQKMKDIEKDGFEEIKVNFFDIITADAMKQTMDLSHQSILEQIQLDNNDYTGMLKDQYQLIQDYSNKITILEEEKRLLNIKIQELENKKRR